MFDATFTGVKGNEWWVQATVSGNQPIAKVEARVNCGSSWVALDNQGWGWARSFRVPSGSKVDFRATSASGATDLSGGYIWPGATPTAACSVSTLASATRARRPRPFPSFLAPPLTGAGSGSIRCSDRLARMDNG